MHLNSQPRIRVDRVSRVSHQIVSKSQAHLRVVRFLIFALRQHMIRPRVPLSQPYRNPLYIININYGGTYHEFTDPSGAIFWNVIQTQIEHNTTPPESA
jgi:hypothetical protein